MPSVREVMAICYSNTGDCPSESLLAHWYTDALWAVGLDCWVMQRGGYQLGGDGGPPLLPPSPPAQTSRVLYLGPPVGAIEFANRVRSDGLAVDYLAVGITGETPPVAPGMLRRLERIFAPPQASAWLRQQGVDRTIELAWPGTRVEAPLPHAEALHLAWEDFVEPGAERLGFPVKHRAVKWREGGKLLAEAEVLDVAARADVFVRRTPSILDDPLDWAFATQGVPVISLQPRTSLAQRLVVAARLRRQGLVQGVRPEPEAGLRLRLLLEGATEAEPLESLHAQVQLGVVVPFGGLPVAGLQEMLTHLQAVKPAGVPVVLGWLFAQGSDEGTRVEGAVAGLVDGGGRVYSPGPWNLSKARNVGYQRLLRLAPVAPETTHVVFLDADLYPTPEFFTQLQHELEGSPDVVLTPFVQQTDGSFRPGTGVSIYPVSVLERVGLFDEGFTGWGYEDLDLLARVKRAGVPVLLFGPSDGSWLKHRDHAERWTETRAAAWQHYQQRAAERKEK